MGFGRRLPEFITGSSSNKFTVTAAAAFIVLSLVLIATVCSPISYLPLKFALSGTKPPEQTCESREQRSSYLKHRSPELPPYLLSKLQEYERRHRRCGPLSESFNTTSPLGTHNDFSDGGDCKFVVYTPSQGLGNRILGLTSTFLFALLTDRVLLVDFSADMDELFCEPFPNSTWLLPGNFPFRSDFYGGWFRDVYSYGKLLEKKEKTDGDSSSSPALLQIFLQDKYNEYDKLFFKDENQGFVERVPWLVLIHDGYFIPCLFQMQSFRSELEKLFPDQETVFHHLVKYLFSPSNQAWGQITGFYEAYLAKAEERIGFQIRVFEPKQTPFTAVMKQITSCTQKHRLILPQSDEVTLRNEKSKSILVASLSRKYYEEIDWMYGTRRRQSTGIAVYQASHEGKQHSGDNSHNMKAWMDIYLLSTSDVLVTSSMSTFGYVAAGIAGVKPWIVMIPDPYHPRGANESACERAINLEPCFHFPPWFAYPDPPGTGGPVGRCEDVSWGLKLVGGHKTRR
ncbi:unnamed protein product [Linum tenue]|uniref:Fucosyltransferase n=1 Tax=Linum tenue TaxID=586396 RepID=A0AAV0KIP1_9ROSI|nr:unnamed protein product [Linum tenue]